MMGREARDALRQTVRDMPVFAATTGDVAADAGSGRHPCAGRDVLGVGEMPAVVGMTARSVEFAVAGMAVDAGIWGAA